jgi:hypothetical protein
VTRLYTMRFCLAKALTLNSIQALPVPPHRKFIFPN